MVARLADLPVFWLADSAAAASAREMPFAEYPLAHHSARLLKRARGLAGVRVGRNPLSGGVAQALHLSPGLCQSRDNCFIKNRVFALIDDQCSVQVRVPDRIAEDLIENGLGVQFGRNLLTWPPRSEHQFETTWRIVLHAYWDASGAPPRARRRLWSEWVINHD